MLNYRSVAAWIVVGCTSVALSAGQEVRSDSSGPTFEVASVRVNSNQTPASYYTVSPGRLVVVNYPVQFVVARAYDIEAPFIKYKLTGGSASILFARVDINATIPAGTTERSVPLMLRQLLAERFNLRIRTESRATSVYELIAERDGQFGPDLNPSEHNCEEVFAKLRADNKRPVDGVPPPRDAKRRALCWMLSSEDPLPRGGFRIRNAGDLKRLILDTQAFVDRPIVDGTGLKGNFEWQLIFNPDPIGATEFPSLFTAFVEQLGLRLRPATLPYEVFVIEALEAPKPQ